MTAVRPPIQKLPPSLGFIRNNPEIPDAIRQVLADLADYLQEDQFFEYQLWKRTGGGSDLIEETVAGESYENSFSSAEIQERVGDTELIEDLIPTTKNYRPIVADSNYTAVDMDYVEARSNAVIQLDTKANPGSDIIVANGDGSRIKIVGDVKIKSICNHMYIRNAGTSLHFKAFCDYWRIV